MNLEATHRVISDNNYTYQTCIYFIYNTNHTLTHTRIFQMNLVATHDFGQ